MRQIPTKAWSMLCKLFQTKVLYLCGERYYSVDFEHHRLRLITDVSDEQLKQVSILVLARSNYSEKVDTVPVSKRMEAIKLARRQVQHKKSFPLFRVWPSHDGKTPVSYFSYSPLPPALKPNLVLPESLVLQYGVNKQLDVVQAEASLIEYAMLLDSATCYLATKAGRSLSAVSAGLVTTPQLFAMSQGISGNQVVNWQPAQAQVALVSGIIAAYQYLLHPGLNIKHQSERQFSFESTLKLTGLASAFITAYLLGANWLASYMLDEAKESQRLLAQEANAVLTVKQSLDASIDRFTQLEPLLPQSINNMLLWQLLAGIYEQQGEVSRIEREGKRYRIGLEVASASAALSYLIDSPGVVNARFDGNVRANRGKDNATVVFELEQQQGLQQAPQQEPQQEQHGGAQ